MTDLIQRLNEKSNSALIMGVVNVTPDSFSDGGAFFEPQNAIQHAMQLLEEGADILDIGGESTRPGADIISDEDEVNRVVPVIEGVKEKASFISIDTRNAQTMHKALKAGANIINDVSGLMHDPESIAVAAESNCPVCIMHMKGTPQTMQDSPIYDDVVDEVLHYFEERLNFCSKNGVNPERVVLDPGIGFGKTLDHNVSILKHMQRIKAMGSPVLLGTSRKSFIGAISGEQDAKKRFPGSLASLLAVIKHVDIVRVHDVAETRQALDVYQAICCAD